MAQPRSAAYSSLSGEVFDNNEVSLGNVIQITLAGSAPRKRQRDVPVSSKKRRRGEQGLCLNLDELYIIFAYIYPMDLLNLARTCKSLRGLLMHRSSAFLWKTALRQVEGLPDCPPDLTEPEYTNLVFSTRCHGCDKPAKTVLWNIRRRYCPACKIERLLPLRSCDKVIRENNVLPYDGLTIRKGSGQWVDRDQLNSFVHDYLWSSDQTRFLDEKREQRQIIFSHALQCEYWQQQKGRVHRFDLEVLRQERQTNFFERLRQCGYEPEVNFFRSHIIDKCHKFVSKKYKPLTDAEWDRVWPEWSEIMNDLRSQRLESIVYPQRRLSLVSEYNRYVTHLSRDFPFELLPHVADLARFPPFRDIIETPEDICMNDKPFTSAFAQLPTLVDEWMKKLKSDIAGMVNVPTCLSDTVSDDRGKVSSSSAHAESSQADWGKLHLACAIFRVDVTGAFSYPELLSVSMRNDVMFTTHETSSSTIASGVIPGIQFLEEAPYVIHACGLDPNVANVRDMDHRNARLRCLSCPGRTLVMNWRHAIWHARFYHCIGIGLAPLSESPRWQLIGDEHIDTIQAVERSVQKAFSPDWTRCLICRPRVGDAMLYAHAVHHFTQFHHLSKDEIEEGTHYKLMGIRDVCVVEMVQVGEQVTFRVLEE